MDKLTRYKIGTKKKVVFKVSKDSLDSLFYVRLSLYVKHVRRAITREFFFNEDIILIDIF